MEEPIICEVLGVSKNKAAKNRFRWPVHFDPGLF
jgi:hypothetical protein